MYMIKDMPKLERPRERLLYNGAESLSSYELIAILLRVGSQGESVIELAKSLVNSFVDLSELGNMTVEELSAYKGIGKTKAITILAAVELGKRVLSPQKEKIQISSPANVYEMLKNELSLLKQEVLVVLFLDIKSCLITKKTIFIGSLNQSLVHPREVFMHAIKHASSRIIIVHNHPSGDPTPSAQDVAVTKAFQEAGNLLGVKVMDHIIIGSNSYRSILNYDFQNKRR
ncbi:MAG: DNA repair protein RadC [Candidatus Izemoplasmatales bacterium]|nr:DNA repair protein RadC [Candidatus Izemoplasmatales bacterium]